MRLENRAFDIVGVAPAGFHGVEVGRMFDVAVPICAAAALGGDSGVLDDNFVWWLSTMGRLRPGWSVERATAYLQTISPALFRETVSRSGDDGSAKSPPMRDTIIASTWPITGAS